MRRFLAAVAILSLAACAGSGSPNVARPSNGLLPASFGKGVAPETRHRKKRVSAYAQIVIPRHRHHKRTPDFISSATRGIKIVATYTGPGSSSGAFVQTTVAALGPNAAGCQASSSSIVCVVTATVWEGNDHIVVTTYDTPPSGGTFPSSAHIIGMATIDTTIAGGKTPYISLFLGGEIGSIHASPAYSTVPADGSNHDAAIVVAPRDFGNQPITAGKNDPYANPIAVNLTEAGGSGHAVLFLNGKNAGSSATLKYSNDALVVRYDGGGKAGYTDKITLSASGASSENLQVSPLFVEGNGVVSHALGLNGTASGPTLTITEKDAPVAQTYGVTRSGCGGIVNVSPVSGSGASARFTASGGASASASGCFLSVVDGLYGTTLVLPVTNTPIAGGVSVNGVTITEYAVGAIPGPVTVGPDNNIWFEEGGSSPTGGGSNQIASLNPGTGTTSTPITVQNSSSIIYDIAAGSDGALWMPDFGNNDLDRIVTATNTQSHFQNFNIDCAPSGIAAGSGSLWVLGCGQLFYANLGGGMVRAAPSTTNPTEIVQGPDGALYWADGTNVDRYDPNTTAYSQIADPQGGTVSHLASAPTDGAGGAVWFTSNVFATTTIGYINRIPTGSATAANKATIGSVSASAEAAGIAAGVDDAVWFTDFTNSKIYRLKFAAGTTPTAFPTKTAAAGPWSIVLSPDGSFWFNETSAGNIGHLVP